MNRIKAIRKIIGMSQTELARKAKVSQPYLHDLELSVRGAKQETWARIAEALGVSIEDIQADAASA